MSIRLAFARTSNKNQKWLVGMYVYSNFRILIFDLLMSGLLAIKHSKHNKLCILQNLMMRSKMPAVSTSYTLYCSNMLPVPCLDRSQRIVIPHLQETNDTNTLHETFTERAENQSYSGCYLS